MTPHFIGNQRMNFIQGTIKKKNNDIYFSNQSLALKVHSTHTKTLKTRTNNTVMIGIRPENIYDKVYAKHPTSGNTLKSKIKVMLPAGDYAMLHLLVGNQKIITKVSAYEKLANDQKIDVVVDMSKALYFELQPETIDEKASQIDLGRLIC